MPLAVITFADGVIEKLISFAQNRDEFQPRGRLGVGTHPARLGVPLVGDPVFVVLAGRGIDGRPQVGLVFGKPHRSISATVRP